MPIAVHQTDDAADALSRAGEFLATRPVEHNLVLTILHDRVARPEPGHYWIVSDDGVIVGVALQSPIGFFATLTPLARPHAIALAQAIARTVPELPGINGEAGTTAAFAGHWAEIRRHPVRPDIGQRLYRLGTLLVPENVPGRLRPATVEDQPNVLEWINEFHVDIGEPPLLDPAAQTNALIVDGRVWLWDDNGPRSMVGCKTTVEGIARIGPVYTPPRHRRRGYAAACTAAVSQHLLDHEAAGCVLYTALANPTSNAVYRRLGYEAVAETMRYTFGS